VKTTNRARRSVSPSRPPRPRRGRGGTGMSIRGKAFTTGRQPGSASGAVTSTPPAPTAPILPQTRHPRPGAPERTARSRAATQGRMPNGSRACIWSPVGATFRSLRRGDRPARSSDDDGNHAADGSDLEVPIGEGQQPLGRSNGADQPVAPVPIGRGHRDPQSTAWSSRRFAHDRRLDDSRSPGPPAARTSSSPGSPPPPSPGWLSCPMRGVRAGSPRGSAGRARSACRGRWRDRW
jgi:hypothetical protein